LALFARRTIKRALDLLRQNTLTSSQLNKIVGQLNSCSRHVIPTEWEVILLAAFAKHAQLKHEDPVGAGFPDLFVMDAGEDNDVTFVADITAASDFGVDEANPTDHLYEEIITHAIATGLRSSALGWHIGYRMEGSFPDRRVKVLLPNKSELHARLQNSVLPFLRQAKAQPGSPRELVWAERDIDFRLSYDPARRHSDFSGPIIPTVPYSKTRNTIYRSLKRKADKLAKTKFRGARGILVGDGDCYALQRLSGGGGNSYHAGQIIAHFLEKHPSITFVTTSGYEYKAESWNRVHALNHKVYFKPTISVETQERLHAFLDDVFGEIPPPVASPNNALRDVINRRELSRGMALGAYHWRGHQQLKIPARVFLGLIGDTLSEREFKILFYRTIPPNGGPLLAFFTHVLIGGTCLRSVSVEATPDKDNDWVVFDCSPGTSAVLDDMASPATCTISTIELVRFFAGMDYAMHSRRPNQSSLHELPELVRRTVKAMLQKGQLLESMRLAPDLQTIQLFFGQKDAAISRYW
jgi:hypothetical protein